jgi:uncharacterized protein YecE (DUF72 family)
MNLIDNTFYSGTSGLVVSISKNFYPAAFQGKSRLHYYASLFNSIEINSTFHKMPMVSTIQKWVASVPPGFQFSFKLSKSITHVKGLVFNPGDIDLFMETIVHAGDKRGCLLLQFPPSLKIDKFTQLEKLLTNIKRADPHQLWKVALEFRNTSWYDKKAYDLLREHKMSMVIQDLPASATPTSFSKAGFVYLRFHGPDGRYRGSYSDEFLRGYAQYIKTWIDEEKMVYCYFNNTMGDAVKNLQTLNQLLQS